MLRVLKLVAFATFALDVPCCAEAWRCTQVFFLSKVEDIR